MESYFLPSHVDSINILLSEAVLMAHTILSFRGTLTFSQSEILTSTKGQIIKQIYLRSDKTMSSPTLFPLNKSSTGYVYLFQSLVSTNKREKIVIDLLFSLFFWCFSF